MAPAPSAPAPGAGADGFERTGSGGWSTADAGGAYQLDEPGTFSVDGSRGLVTIERGHDRNAVLGAVAADVDTTVAFSVSNVQTGGSGLYFSFKLRHTAERHEYRPRLRVTPGGTAFVSVVRVDGPTQAVTAIGPERQLTFPVLPDTTYLMRSAVVGIETPQLGVKVWPAGTTEPTEWQAGGLDISSAAISQAGRLGLWWYVSGSGTTTTMAIAEYSASDLAAIQRTPVAPETTAPAPTTTAPAPDTTVPAPTTAPAPDTTVPAPTTAPAPSAPPVARFAVGTTGTTATFDASASSDPDGDALTYAWAFGDGAAGTGVRAEHTFTSPGERTVILTVTDPSGNTATATQLVSTLPAGAILPNTAPVPTTPHTFFVATNGSDANPGTLAAPYATVTKALNAIPAGQSGTVVVRGGTYRQGQLVIAGDKQVRIMAYPGEVPVFNGAAQVTSWTDEGALRFAAYTPMPVTDGSGIGFSSGQNLTGGGMGKHPDQVWVGSAQLRQVATKAEVVAGTFWVDGTNRRLYLTAADVAAGPVEASNRRQFATVFGRQTVFEGFEVTRFSNTASDYGVILVNQGVHGTVLRNLVVSDSAFQAIQYAGGTSLAGIIQGALLEHVTVTRSNWMGVSATLVDDFTMRSVRITNSNQFDEFTHSPQSGALKTSRVRRALVADSVIADNRSHGLWFDQSNVDVDVIGNDLRGNTGSAIFWEISDDLLLADNVIIASGGARAVKIAGASGVKMVNNTIVGGADPVGIYVDNRSKPGCADPSKPLCANSYSSDRDTVRPLPASLDWMPRIDVMVNNVIALPTAAGYCGGTAAMCVTGSNAGAVASLESVFHQADPARGIPASVVDGNVYVVTSGAAIRTTAGAFTTVQAFATSMATAPVNLTVEAAGRSGAGLVTSTGALTAALAAQQDTTTPLPAAAALATLPAGTKHLGALRPVG